MRNMKKLHEQVNAEKRYRKEVQVYAVDSIRVSAGVTCSTKVVCNGDSKTLSKCSPQYSPEAQL